MWQKLRKQRTVEVEEEEHIETPPDDNFHNEAYNMDDQPPRRRSIVDTVIRDHVSKVPESEMNIKGIYKELAHMWDELAYQTKCMPGMACRVNTRLELIITKMENKIKKIDDSKVSLRIGGKEFTFRASLIIILATTLMKAYSINPFFWI